MEGQRQLKPCPFCGGEAKIFGNRAGCANLSCRGSWRYSGEYKLEEEAAEHWNSRKRSEVMTEAMLKAVEDPLQELDNMDDPLEPIKVVSAIKSEGMKLEIRKERRPEDISELDYTIIAALWKRVPAVLEKDDAPESNYICKECGNKLYPGEADTEYRKSHYVGYCRDCGQRLHYMTGKELEAEEQTED